MYSKNNCLKFFLIFIFILSLNKNVYSSTDFNYFNYIKNLKSFSTSFTQHTYEENGSLFSQSFGNLIYKKKSKYILEYRRPNKIKFISDGSLITTYDEDLEQVIIQSYKSKFKKNIIDIMVDKDFIEKKFIIKIHKIEGENHIKFIPLNQDIEDNTFLLVIKNESIKSITFMNDFNQSVTMEFKNFTKNARILNSSFKIDIPENFDVIVYK